MWKEDNVGGTGILLDFKKHLLRHRTDNVDLMANSKAKDLLSRWDEIKNGTQDLTLTEVPSNLAVKKSILEWYPSLC